MSDVRLLARHARAHARARRHVSDRGSTSACSPRIPKCSALFHRSTPGAQNKMFAQKLTALVDHLDDPSWLGRELSTLAANHVTYGVTAEMYPWVGEALIATLREACGEAWIAEAERAWTDAYASLVTAILGPA